MRSLITVLSRAALAVVAFAAAGRAANANPIDAFGLGARGAALGGAQTASADDSSANYYNPALLVSLEDIHIDVGYRLASPTLELGGADVGPMLVRAV